MDIKLGSLGLVSTTKKRIDKSSRYDSFFAPCDFSQRIVRKAGELHDVVNHILGVIEKYNFQVARFAPTQRDTSIYKTCANLWTFWYNRCYYLEDAKGEEQLRVPNRSYWEGNLEEHGIDCDDFSIAVSSCLVQLNIPHRLRIARYAGVDHFQHIYVIANDGTRDIVIDCVLDAYDTEKPPAEVQDFWVIKPSINRARAQEKQNIMAGIDIAVLTGVSDRSELMDIVSGSDFSGIGSVNSTPDAIYNHLVKTRELVSKNPELIREVEHPDTFLPLLDFAIKHWYTPQREQALQRLSAEENRINGLLGTPQTELVSIDYHSDLSGTTVGIGKVEWSRKFFSKVKEAVSKENLKEAGQTLIKYNPLVVAARAGVLLAMKTNLFHLAAHLKWGYLTKEQAQQQGFELTEWAKASEALRQAQHLFVNDLQGDANHFRDAILSGRAGGLNGVFGLGIEPVSTATTTAASVPFIAKLKALISKIDLKKLLAKVNPSKLLNKPENNTTKETPVPNTTTDESSRSLTITPPPASPPQGESGTGLPAWVVPAGLITVGGYLMFSSKKGGVSGLSGIGATRKRVKKAASKKQVAAKKTVAKKAVAKKTIVKKKTSRKVSKPKADKPRKQPARLVGTKTFASPTKSFKGHLFAGMKRNSKTKRKNPGKPPTLYL